MSEYQLKDAAAYLGITADDLQSMNWAQFGPVPIARSYWSPIYTRTSLDAWLANRPDLAYNNPAIVKPGVWAVKRMRVR